jgi:dihydrofolate reductase
VIAGVRARRGISAAGHQGVARAVGVLLGNSVALPLNIGARNGLRTRTESDQSVWGADAHLMGRQTYEDMAAVWPDSSSDYAAPMNEIPKVVFSKTLERAEWPESQIAAGSSPMRSRG